MADSVKESKNSNKILDTLSKLGCGYEGIDGNKYFVVNIQPHCDFWKICNFLTDSKVDWEHADPTYDEIYAKESK